MNTYKFVVKFKTTNNQNYLYNTSFVIEANSNNEAKKIGCDKWNEFKSSKERLKEAILVKVVCRKKEDKPRTRKATSLQKALSVLNEYIMEDLSK